MRSYCVPVSFYVEAFDETDAECRIAEYLENAAACVLDPRGVVGVDVEGHQVAPCPADLDAPHFLPEDFAA